MIKVPGRTGDGRPLLVLGLSGENMTRLMAGEPMVVDTGQLGPAFAHLPSMSLVLLGGRTEQAIIDDLNKEVNDELRRRQERQSSPDEENT